ncbi:MAG: AGE family epimerase/isomerase, partial [Lewinella sp.]|nr:AGE family epimerase/isomerase [Lewinella sp.]
LDRELNGYLSAFARDWSPMADIRLSEKDMNEAKIMNTHIHILEAYTNFYRLKPFTALREALTNVIELLLDYFILPETHSLQVYFDENWVPKGDAISFGHNIETSWLLWEAATVLEDEVLLERLRPICLAMARAVLEQGLDDDGGLLYEAGPKGIQDTDKHWWTQAEAVVGFWNAWQLSGEGPFASAARRVWTFIQLYIKDGQHGEWHWRTDRAGRPILTEDKGGPWKAPYHNSRMCMEMLKRLA